LESPQRLANRVARDVIFLRQPILNQTLAGYEMPIEDGTTNPVCNHFMQSTGYLADGFQCAFSLSLLTVWRSADRPEADSSVPVALWLQYTLWYDKCPASEETAQLRIWCSQTW